MIQKLPLSGEFLQSYSDRDQLIRILASAIDKKRRLSNRDKYKYLRFLQEITAAPNLVLEAQTLSTLAQISLNQDETEAVRSEARAVLLQLAKSNYTQVRKLLNQLQPNQKAAIDAICQFEYDEADKQELNRTQVEAQRKLEEEKGSYDDLNGDELVLYGVVPIELVEELQEATGDWKRREQIVENIQFVIETLPQTKVALVTKFADSFLKFVVQAMLADQSLKVMRVGIRLLHFIVASVDHLEQKTNIVYLIQNVTELFNETMGSGIVRSEA